MTLSEVMPTMIPPRVRDLLKHVPAGDLTTLLDFRTRSEMLLDNLKESALFPLPKKAPRRFSLRELAWITGLSYRTIYSRLKHADFPQGLQVGRTRQRFWTLAEVHEILRLEGRSPERNSSLDKPIVLSLSTFERGIGTTTISVHLAQYLAIRGYRVLLIDLDPEGSATRLLGAIGHDELRHNEIANESSAPALRTAIHRTYWHHLDLVPSTMHDCLTEAFIAQHLRGSHGSMEKSGVSPLEFHTICTLLRQQIDTVAHTYDAIVIDTPPTSDLSAVNALCAADAVIVPVRPTTRGIAAAMQLLNVLHLVLDRIRAESRSEHLPPKHWDFFGFLITRFIDNNGYHSRVRDLMRMNFGAFTMRNSLPDCELLQKLGFEMKTAYDIERYQGDRRHFEQLLDSLNRINAEIEQLIRSLWPSHHTDLAKELGVTK